ncbi:MAG: UDP-glucose 4-epimerase, partial [Myxococcota bacterium]
MKNFLVTGGAGFIGSNLVRALLKRGDKVRILDDLSSGRRENLAGIESDVEFVEGDLRDEATLARVVEGRDFILHQAAIPSVTRSVSEPGLTHDVNVNGTFRLFEAARAAGVQRIVFAGSSAVYGDSE